jgi:HlyD family secretion protein
MATAAGSKRVWVLQDGRPTPVAVSAGATDGSFTAVSGGPLQSGQALVVAAAAGAS